MFKRFYNAAVLSATLTPDGPILVVKGGHSPDPTAPDMAFVRTQHCGRTTVYLPGASLKGVIRAHAERIVATQGGAAAAESPFGRQPRRRQAEEQRHAGATPFVYRASCETDKMFGSTEIAGRFRVDDAYPSDGAHSEANATDVRFGVAIDRAKQSVRVGGLFESEAVVAGRFALNAGLDNYELWMLALLLQVIDDVDAGLVQIGHSKSRGFGSVRVVEPCLRVRQLRGATTLAGAGAIERDSVVRSDYGLDDQDGVAVPPGGVPRPAGLFEEYEWRGWNAVRGVRDAILAARWDAFVKRANASAALASGPRSGAPRG